MIGARSAEPADLKFLENGGETSRLIAAFDWSQTPLGPLAGWSKSLRSTVAMVLRSSVPMALLWGTDGIMLYNDAYAVIAGGRHPQCLGSKARESWPEISEFNDHVVRTCLNGGTLSYTDQMLMLMRHGRPEPVWLNLDYSPAVDDSGVPAGVIAIVVETTMKVRAEQWGAAERERLRQMFEQAPGFMAMLRGPLHVFDLANPAYLQLTGHRDLLGKTVREVFPELAGQGYFELLDEVFNSGKAFAGTALPVTLESPNASAEPRFLDLVYQPVRDAAGHVTGIFVEGSDVTDRVRAEMAVRESEARNRQILDSAIDYAIIAVDLDGKVTRWNDGARQTMGWTEAEMLGRDLSRIFTPEDRDAGRAGVEMRTALAAGRSSDERWHLRKSGESFWATGELTPIHDDSGRAVGLVKVLRDRTEQHRAADALRRSEARLARAQEAGGVGVFSMDLADNSVLGTPEFCRIYGLEPRQSIPAADIAALVQHEDWREISVGRDVNWMNTPLAVEYRIRRADNGHLRWIARKAEFERDAAGRPVRMVGVIQDVTERRMAQRAIEESAAQFQALSQAMPNHVWTARPDGALDWFNDRVYEYSGRGPGELANGAWTRLVHPEDIDAVLAAWRAALAAGGIYEMEMRLRRRDGTFLWHLARALPILSSDGVVSRWVGTNTDIHQHKMAEAQNTRDRERIWNSTNDLMGTVDLDGIIKSANPAWSRLLGLDDADIISHPFAAIVDAEDRGELARVVTRLVQGEAVHDLENRLVHKDGQRFLIAWSAEPVDDMFYIVGRNITEQRAAEEALRQAHKMEAVGQLTGGIAHDFNNLLQGINGCLDLVQKRLAQGRTADVERLIAGAVASANRAASLTHRLLAFARRQPLDPRPVRANARVSSMDELLRRTLGEGIELELRLAGDLWLTKCDSNQLESAILNLVINARDAMPHGGRLAIETCNAHIDGACAARQRDVRPGQYVCISVSDTGLGMSRDIIDRAFEPFFTTKPIGQGTGLGLSMIYGFTQQSNGHARIYSEVGRGTTVKLYLPRHRGPEVGEETTATAHEPRPADHGETVLVVEDEPLVRALILEVLHDLGYQTLEAVDGPSGLECLQSRRRIDFLITDIGLPGLNGRQVAEAGRELRPDLKILFMTGYAENAALASGFLGPGMTMITKPFTMETLAARVRQSLEDR